MTDNTKNNGSKHTPGPWVVAPKRNRWGDMLVIPEGSDLAADGYLAAVGTGGHAATEADARLIAAAPELPEALRAVLDNAPDDITGPVACDAYAAARALLAKVDGHE